MVRVNAGRLWAAGLATAVVVALLATVAILIIRSLLHLAILAPKADGAWGNAHTLTYALASAAIALAATAVLHLLLVATPRATMFFAWIMGLLTIIAVFVPLTLVLVDHQLDMIATTALDLLLALTITRLLVGAGREASAQANPPSRPPVYGTRRWLGGRQPPADRCPAGTA